MGRPPCCDKDGIKKGPWTPEEDIILVSYIQEHGPGNWRSVPTNTGLLRCSKSCRLRWTNYLRPGIKRGNFSSHEEGMIIHLQALLGNKWAAIASYLPQRTDNDIKNYWNTHLKKKLKKLHSTTEFVERRQQPPTTHVHNKENIITMASSSCSSSNHVLSATTRTTSAAADQSHGAGGGYYCQDHHKTNSDLAASCCCSSLSRILSSSSSTASSSQQPASASTYASSTENISRLLEGWMKSCPSDSTTSKELASQVVQETSKVMMRNHDNNCIYNHDHEEAMMEPQEAAAADNKAAEDFTVVNGETVLDTDEIESLLAFNRNLNHRDKDEAIDANVDINSNCHTTAAAAAPDAGYMSSSRSNCCYSPVMKGTESITSLLSERIITTDHHQHQLQGTLISKQQHNHAQIITDHQTSGTAAASGATMLLEKWLLDETSSHVEDIMAVPSLF